PSFSIVVILTLALGIGANSAVFSAIDAILLRPLPFPEGDRLMELQQINQKVQKPQTLLAPLRTEDWNRLNSTFEGITGYYTEDDSETSGIVPEKIEVAYVAPRFFQVFGVAPAVGREFNSVEEQFGGPNAVLISNRLWRRRFGADPDVLRKQLRILEHAWSIIGVLPASFAFPDRDAEIWVPVPPDAPPAQHREVGWYIAIGRLKPGVTVDQARANLETVQAQLGNQYPQTDADLTAGVVPLKETTIGGARGSLWMLFGAVSLLLLIACTNIVALLLARGAQRQHEISVRLSLTSRSQVSPRTPLQWFLVGVQVALAVTLLGGAGLLLRSFQALGRVSPGFDPQNVLTFHITGSYGETADGKKLQSRIWRTLE